MDDQLGDHWVIVDRYLTTFYHARINTYGSGLLWWSTTDQSTCRRQKISCWIFRVDSRFDRPTRRFDVTLSESKFITSCYPDHALDQIDAGYKFGYRMLNLQSGVHFQKIEILFTIDHELYGSGGYIVHCLCQSHCLTGNIASRLVVQKWRWRLLDHFLMATLQRTLPLTQMNCISVLIGDNLNLDVSGILDELLNKYTVIAKVGFRLTLRTYESLPAFVITVREAHSLPATS